MKVVILTALLFATSLYSYDDEIDKVSFYVNGDLITTTSDMKGKELHLNIYHGDTVKLVVWTDWGGHFNSRIDIADINGLNIMTIEPNRDNRYDATYWLLSHDYAKLKGPHKFILHYDSSTDIEPWEFALLTINKEEGSR
jgi:hypothetical protein